MIAYKSARVPTSLKVTVSRFPTSSCLICSLPCGARSMIRMAMAADTAYTIPMMAS
jgi:hypothetical protein